jgi:molybdate transport system ATP-binding protein
MSSLQLHNVSALFDKHFYLKEISWHISQGEHWVIVGPNGAGKSALAAMLVGQGERQEGEIITNFATSSLVSFEQQKAMLAAERCKDSADLLDIVPIPSKAREILFSPAQDAQVVDETLCQHLLEIFNFSDLLDRDFIALSTGETRKLLLIRALIYRPQLLILDEPFDGLDAAASQALASLLVELKEHMTLVMVLNRLDEIPDFISHFLYMDEGVIKQKISRTQQDAVAEIYQLLSLKTAELALPGTDEQHQAPPLKKGEPLLRMRNVAVRYADHTVFENLNWQIDGGQHWQVSGPNGSGKTCLLNMISGDHPQCYCNDIYVCGYQRGSGESIWQIKQHMGIVSNSLHLAYRVGVSALNTIVSGFYDSIGLYQQPTDKQLTIGRQWLKLLAMNSMADIPFTHLSFGAQRLLLIARAMVKHPPLLLLDEPCQGLDDINRQLVLALIERICGFENTTVIYVNHHGGDKIKGIDRHLDLTAY